MFRWQNTRNPKGRVPSYYAGNKIYGRGAYAQNDVPGRTSRRIHDGFSLTKNYGLDTNSDDINSSPFSSPFYINGRYNAQNLTTQRGNSSSIQGVERLADIYTTNEDFSDEDIETTIELWQGKQIRFSIPYDSKVVGHTITLKNTGGCTGILSIYFSTSPNENPIMETSVDLCSVSQDKFEHLELRPILTASKTANRRKRLYVRMEIWDEVILPPNERTLNPFNTGKKIEIAATGKRNHEACIYKLQEKNRVVSEQYDYQPLPSQPLIGFLYNDWVSVPTDRVDNIKTGATVSKNGYRYDVMCCKRNGLAEVLIYDNEMDKFVRGANDGPLPIKVDGRVEQLNIAQVTDTDKVTWVYYVDGYSPLQRFKIGEWNSSEFPTGSADSVTAEIDAETWYNSDLGSTSGTYVFTYHNGHWEYNDAEISLSTYGISLVGGGPSEGSTITVLYTVAEGGTKNIESIEFVDARPVVGAKLIMFHNNRLYLAGFRNDPNLVQVSAIDAEGPNFTQFPYRFYAPNRSPYDTSLNPITAMTEVASDQIMISLLNGYTIYQTYGSKSSTGLEDNVPTQISTFTDSAGVRTQGDIVNYKGVVYSFDEKEGLRRFTGSIWRELPEAQTISSLFDRVDMDKPRKLWGTANKLYFNYTDRIDGKYKCIIWDQQMNYQSYPMFQDSDIPFCDIRTDETEALIGIHPDYPCVMKHYAEDVWRRFDSPIVFRRDSKYMSIPGNATDIIVKRCHVKVLANSNRWWWIALNSDKQMLTQRRGKDLIWRQPVWDTINENGPVELPFATEDIIESDAVYRLSLMDLRIQCESLQVRVQAKTFRAQASLLSVELEVAPKTYL